jgi:recombination protein RecT
MATSVVASDFQEQLIARAPQIANALPSHIRPEYFQRATLTALAQNPKLLDADRRSLWNALMRCAQDGLIPDGRQAALVIFKDQAQYMQMVQGVRLLVQQSGKVTRFEQVVVHQNDEFNYELGDQPHIHHIPALQDRGPPVLVYSIAQYNDGTLSRDVMTAEEVEKVRAVSRAKDSGPWTQWWGEMAKKTIAKRHAKVLPMSNDALAALARDDAEHFNLPARDQLDHLPPPTGRPRLAQQLDAISQTAAEPQSRKRGRPRKPEAATADTTVDDEAEVRDDTDANPPRQLDLEEPPADGWPGPTPRATPTPDYAQGVKDAQAGRAGCLNRDVRDNPVRLADWQKGYNSVANRP